MVLESWGRGGTEAYVRSLVSWLRERNTTRVSICLLKYARKVGQAQGAYPNEVEAIHMLGAWGGLYRYLRLYRLLKRERPDICHLHLYSSLLPAVLVARAAGVRRVVTTLHMPIWHWHCRHRVAWRLALALSHFVMGNSSATLRSVGWPAGDRAALVPPPLPAALLDSRSISIADRSESVSPRAFRIGGAGRLASEKCWADLLHAFAQVTKHTDAECELCLYGDGQERESLRILAKELDVAAQVQFNNFLPQRKLHDAISECDVFVLPSRFEGLGMVAIEAMALGVPTITADFEASDDYIKHGVTGHRFSRGDVDALADLLHWHRSNPKEAATVGNRGRSFVRETFRREVVFQPLLDAYSCVTEA